MVDLHAHSTASDGTLSPTKLVARAFAEGLRAIALTDHDTAAGLDEAADAAAQRRIGFVPGIELEVDWEPGIFHVLGLGLKRWHGTVGEHLARIGEFRKERNLAMIGLLNKAGITVTYEDLVAISGHTTVGRPHFAQWLVQHGVVPTAQAAFDSLIGEGRPYYLPKKGLSTGKTCDVIHEAGGHAIVAHPMTLRMGWDELEKSLKRWRGEGLDGVEAYHPTMSLPEAHRLAALAEQLGLIVTAGSDYHGPPRTDRELGRTCAAMPIDDRFLEPIGVYHGTS